MNTQTHALPPLITTQELQQLQHRILQANDNRRRAGITSEPGSAHSHFRGQGMELLDVRPYQAGDDIRHMDWRAMARSGRAISKVFSEERGRELVLAVDRRPNMFFGTRSEIKASSAARAAAILGFSALSLREPVAAAIFEHTRQDFAATRTTSGLLPALIAIASAPSNTNTAPSTLAVFLKQLCQQFKRHTTLCLISDFHDITQSDNQALAALADYFDIIALQIIDPAEEQLQDTGILTLRSPNSSHTVNIDTSNTNIRHQYQTIMAQRQIDLHIIFQRHNIQMRKLYTNVETFSQLDGLL